MANLREFTEILNKGHLRFANQAEDAFTLIADGKADNIQIKEFLLAINNRGIDVNLLSSAVKVLGRRMIKVRAPENSIDVCGTGGDNLNSLNISTAVSFVVAAAGVAVAKHGNKAVSSSCGSADIFSQLGIDISQSKEQTEESLFNNNLAFIFAPLYHPALKYVAVARKELGVRTIFNFLGPLLNPAQTNYQLIGCCDRQIAEVMFKTTAKFHKKNCWVVFGLDGMDEISITDNSLIYKMDYQTIYDSQLFNPQKYVSDKFTIDDLKGKNPTYNAQKLVELLKYQINDRQMRAYHDIVVINSAAALVIAEKEKNFDDAVRFAKEIIAGKKAFELLKKIARNIN